MKKLATFLMIAGLFSFICLAIKQPASELPWFIVSYLAVASVLIFLVVQLQPVKEGEIDKRKWIIFGAIVGIVVPAGGILLTIIPGGFELSLKIPANLSFAFFPFSIVLMGSEFLPYILSSLLLICTIILNIGLFSLLGLLLGTIVGGITRVIRKT